MLPLGCSAFKVSERKQSATKRSQRAEVSYSLDVRQEPTLSKPAMGESGMENETKAQPPAASAWQVKQVYAMAVISLVVGLAIGYLFRGSQSPAPPPPAPAVSQQSPAAGAWRPDAKPGSDETDGRQQSRAPARTTEDRPEQYRSALQSRRLVPGDPPVQGSGGLLRQGTPSRSEERPTRTKLASCFYYQGDVDGAISQLQQSLQYDPKDANSLFNLGMIKLQGKRTPRARSLHGNCS